MMQKVIKIGNSLGMTLPAEYIRKAKISAGQKIETKVRDDGTFEVLAKTSQADKALTASLSSIYLDRVDKFIKRYQPALTQLAKL